MDRTPKPEQETIIDTRTFFDFAVPVPVEGDELDQTQFKLFWNPKGRRLSTQLVASYRRRRREGD